MPIAEQFKIIRKLGNQARRKFGVIYLVEDRVNGEQGVLKAVKKETEQELIEERLRHEARFDFDFQGLPKILGIHESETELLLVRAFVPGVQIDQHWKSLKRKKKLPFLIQFIEKLELIFNHLIEKNIAHCDIKPSNILIEDRGDDFDVHLIDFGLSLELTIEEHRPTLFPLGYAAPELILNHLDLVDQRSDIFSLGVLIWRLYADKLPLTHPNPSIFTNLQLTHPLPEHDTISKKMYAILQKMSYKHQFKLPPNKMEQHDVKEKLAKAMDERYDSLSKVLGDIKKLEKRGFFYQRMSFL
jgi:serine/threonine protein kinase